MKQPELIDILLGKLSRFRKRLNYLKLYNKQPLKKVITSSEHLGRMYRFFVEEDWKELTEFLKDFFALYIKSPKAFAVFLQNTHPSSWPLLLETIKPYVNFPIYNYEDLTCLFKQIPFMNWKDLIPAIFPLFKKINHDLTDFIFLLSDLAFNNSIDRTVFFNALNENFPDHENFEKLIFALKFFKNNPKWQLRSIEFFYGLDSRVFGSIANIIAIFDILPVNSYNNFLEIIRGCLEAFYQPIEHSDIPDEIVEPNVCLSIKEINKLFVFLQNISNAYAYPIFILLKTKLPENIKLVSDLDLIEDNYKKLPPSFKMQIIYLLLFKLAHQISTPEELERILKFLDSKNKCWEFLQLPSVRGKLHLLISPARNLDRILLLIPKNNRETFKLLIHHFKQPFAKWNDSLNFSQNIIGILNSSKNQSLSSWWSCPYSSEINNLCYYIRSQEPANIMQILQKKLSLLIAQDDHDKPVTPLELILLQCIEGMVIKHSRIIQDILIRVKKALSAYAAPLSTFSFNYFNCFNSSTKKPESLNSLRDVISLFYEITDFSEKSLSGKLIDELMPLFPEINYWVEREKVFKDLLIKIEGLQDNVVGVLMGVGVELQGNVERVRVIASLG